MTAKSYYDLENEVLRNRAKLFGGIEGVIEDLKQVALHGEAFIGSTLWKSTDFFDLSENDLQIIGEACEKLNVKLYFSTTIKNGIRVPLPSPNQKV